MAKKSLPRLLLSCDLRLRRETARDQGGVRVSQDDPAGVPDRGDRLVRQGPAEPRRRHDRERHLQGSRLRSLLLLVQLPRAEHRGESGVHQARPLAGGEVVRQVDGRGLRDPRPAGVD